MAIEAAEHLVMPQEVAQVFRSFYDGLRVWFGNGEAALDLRFKRWHGILQGFSMSMLLLAVVMSIWAREVQEGVGSAELSDYTDDRLIWVRGAQRIEHLEKACEITKPLTTNVV